MIESDPDYDFDSDPEFDSPAEFHRTRIRIVRTSEAAAVDIERSESPPFMAWQINGSQVVGSPCLMTRRAIRVFQLMRRYETGHSIFKGDDHAGSEDV